MVARETEKKPRFFNHSYINVHAYLGVQPRAKFWTDEENVREFQQRFNGIRDREDYLRFRDWYLSNTQQESSGNERKDHIPFILEQLSKEPLPLPAIELEQLPFFEMIDKPAKEVVKVKGYKYHNWDSKTQMAV